MSTKHPLYRTERARHTVLTFENVFYMKTKPKKGKIYGQAKTNSDSTTWNHHNLQQSAWILVPKWVTESRTLLYSMCTNACKDTRQALLVDFLFAKRQEMLRLRIPAFHSVSQSKFALFTQYTCKPIAQTSFHHPALLILVHITSSRSLSLPFSAAKSDFLSLSSKYHQKAWKNPSKLCSTAAHHI